MVNQIENLLTQAKKNNDKDMVIILSCLKGSIESNQTDILSEVMQRVTEEVLMPNAKIMKNKVLSILN